MKKFEYSSKCRKLQLGHVILVSTINRDYDFVTPIHAKVSLEVIQTVLKDIGYGFRITKIN